MELEDLSLGKYIRREREAQRLSLLELSNRTGVAYAHLSRIENESTIPSPETIVRICDALGGDLTLMLQKANNLPRVILDRLLERDTAVKLQTLRRAIPGGVPEKDNNSASRAASAAAGNLSEHEVDQLREAMDRLLRLRPHARQAVIELIAVLRDDEDVGESG